MASNSAATMIRIADPEFRYPEGNFEFPIPSLWVEGGERVRKAALHGLISNGGFGSTDAVPCCAATGSVPREDPSGKSQHRAGLTKAVNSTWGCSSGAASGQRKRWRRWLENSPVSSRLHRISTRNDGHGSRIDRLQRDCASKSSCGPCSESTGAAR